MCISQALTAKQEAVPAGSLLSWTDPESQKTQAPPGRTSKRTDWESLTLSGQVSDGAIVFVSIITFDLEPWWGGESIVCTHISALSIVLYTFLML